jgi:flavin-dependent dehydrogenase
MTVATYDVVVVGGGPGGSSAAGFLAAGGLSVALFERESFPRFHVGESLMPATMLLLEQLGVREQVEKAGFQIKFGAMFIDEINDLEASFYFLPEMPWPPYTFQVPRAEFDTILLDHARSLGVRVHQPATVDGAEFDAGGVTVQATVAGVPTTIRARMLVDASGRASFLASRLGERRRVPNLGKVAMFAHYRGAERMRGVEEGNIRVYIAEDGWYWWIPLADGVTSVGAVVHARTARSWTGTQDALYDDMLGRSKHLPRMLANAERITPVHSEANFAYENSPVVGDRFVAVGDAITFVDPAACTSRCAPASWPRRRFCPSSRTAASARVASRTTSGVAAGASSRSSSSSTATTSPRSSTCSCTRRTGSASTPRC